MSDTMINYEKLTNEELDRMSAEKFLKTKRIHKSPILENAFNVGFIDNGVNKHILDWSPTHKDSNQAERYLFPKLIAMSFHVNIEFRKYEVFWINFNKKITREVGIPNNFIDIEMNCMELDQINRTKTIACLYAFDRFNGSEDD